MKLLRRMIRRSLEHLVRSELLRVLRTGRRVSTLRVLLILLMIRRTRMRLWSYVRVSNLCIYQSANNSIAEAADQNNTLNHELCTVFEDSTTGNDAQSTWSSIFVPPITARLNKNLPGTNLSDTDAISIMDLCPFNTVASPSGTISEFCHLFTPLEWRQYDYYQSLGKYYGYGNGNALGPTQGVGFTNELIARLTDTPVHDDTSTNHTLDSNPETFPLGRKLYADFSHDNDMTGIFAALGLYNSTKPLSNTTLENTQQTNGFSASWTVPFAARAYVEKLKCIGEKGELVRVLVNDRVIPLVNCGADEFGSTLR